MNSAGAILGGLIGGAVGAAIWAAIGYFTGYEVGWIAWGIGALVGFGVTVGNRGRGGIAAGGTAAILALTSVLAAKWIVVQAQMNQMLGGDELVVSYFADVILWETEEQGHELTMPDPDAARSIADYYPAEVWQHAERQWAARDEAEKERLRAVPALANSQYVMSWLADEIVIDYTQQRRPVAWPDGFDATTAVRRSHYPADVWADAQKRWGDMSEAERADFEAAVFATAKQNFAMMHEYAAETGFLSSFSPYDLLWFALAVITAFQLANKMANLTGGEGSEGEGGELAVASAAADNWPESGDQPS